MKKFNIYSIDVILTKCLKGKVIYWRGHKGVIKEIVLEVLPYKGDVQVRFKINVTDKLSSRWVLVEDFEIE